MLYGIISDIHSNLEALDAVLAQLGGAAKVICLGDLVGYGPNPNECIAKIRALNISAVAGNHDKAVTGELEMTWFNPRAREAVRWTQKEISPENLQYLKQLPLKIEVGDFQCVHGSLGNPLEEYITSIAEASATFKMMAKALCFIGHSHAPLYFAHRKDGNYDGRRLADGDEVLVEEYKQVIINVGAVGQPRDGDPRAAYGIYNSKTKIFSLHRVLYDFRKTQAKMIKARLPASLIERLSNGR